MNFNKFYSYFLVLSQFILIGLIGINTSIKNANIFCLFLIFIGFALGFWAVFVMQKSKLRITPDVASNATLVKSGPYKYIRHPMYTSVLTVCLGLSLTNFYYLTLFFYITLIAVLLLKIKYEEKLLENHFSDYKLYKKETKRLLPFVL